MHCFTSKYLQSLHAIFHHLKSWWMKHWILSWNGILFLTSIKWTMWRAIVFCKNMHSSHWKSHWYYEWKLHTKFNWQITSTEITHAKFRRKHIRRNNCVHVNSRNIDNWRKRIFFIESHGIDLSSKPKKQRSQNKTLSENTPPSTTAYDTQQVLNNSAIGGNDPKKVVLSTRSTLGLNEYEYVADAKKVFRSFSHERLFDVTFYSEWAPSLESSNVTPAPSKKDVDDKLKGDVVEEYNDDETQQQ